MKLVSKDSFELLRQKGEEEWERRKKKEIAHRKIHSSTNSLL
jgi:hypothetical protein